MMLIELIYIVIVVAFALDAVVRETDPYKSMCRVAAIVALPVLGILLYLLDGRRSSESLSLTSRSCGRCGGVSRLVESRCGEPVTMHNSVTLLHNADKTYSSLIRAVQQARRSILLEYYIFVDDRFGRALCEILVRKARAGVEVCIIYDAVGSWRLSRRMVQRLQREGIDIRPFKPLNFPWFRSGVARRNHRKIAIVDSRVAFTGGINIAKRYIDGNYLGRWRDEHLRIEGEAVERLHRLFAEDWEACGGDPARVRLRGVERGAAGYSPVQIARGDDAGARYALLDIFTAAILRAERKIKIATPYFIPPQGLFDAVRIAIASGVEVEVMVPERGDSWLTSMISEGYLRHAKRAGARVFRYDNGFLHSKVVIIDNLMASVGSANFDYRSLCENLEVATLVYDGEIIRSLSVRFDGDKAQCRVAESEVSSRNLGHRLVEGVLRIFSPLL